MRSSLLACGFADLRDMPDGRLVGKVKGARPDGGPRVLLVAVPRFPVERAHERGVAVCGNPISDGGC
jgi:hypothetical protein